MNITSILDTFEYCGMNCEVLDVGDGWKVIVSEHGGHIFGPFSDSCPEGIFFSPRKDSVSSPAADFSSATSVAAPVPDAPPQAADRTESDSTAAAETMPEIILFIFIFHLHPHKKSVYIVNGIFSAHNSQKKEICFFPAVFPETDGKLPCSC